MAGGGEDEMGVRSTVELRCRQWRLEYNLGSVSTFDSELSTMDKGTL